MKKIKSLVVIFALMVATLSMVAIASAAAEDYAAGYYSGTVSNEDGADVFVNPGSGSNHLQDANGVNIHVAYGTAVSIYSEELDPDLDVWYKVKFNLGEAEYEGYIYTGRVTRAETVITNTPTPSPTVTVSPDKPTEIATAPSAIDNDGKPQKNKLNKGQKDEGNGGLAAYKYIIVLCIVIVVVMVIYTIWVKTSEEKLEKEIERYSGRPKYEPLEGELEEDYEEAKSSYYDHIGLGDQSEKDLGEEIGNPDEIHLDMSGVFGEEEYAGSYSDEFIEEEYVDEEYVDDDSLENLIASLEDKIPDGQNSYNEEELYFENPVEEVDEEIPQPVKTYSRPVKPAASIGDYLGSLSSGDTVVHKVYGEGIVIDNTDDEIIQVEFAGNMKFLKKEKLIAKNLLRMW